MKPWFVLLGEEEDWELGETERDEKRDEEIRAERVDRSAWIPNFQGSGARAGSSIFFLSFDGWVVCRQYFRCQVLYVSLGQTNVLRPVH